MSERVKCPVWGCGCEFASIIEAMGCTHGAGASRETTAPTQEGSGDVAPDGAELRESYALVRALFLDQVEFIGGTVQVDRDALIRVVRSYYEMREQLRDAVTPKNQSPSVPTTAPTDEEVERLVNELFGVAIGASIGSATRGHAVETEQKAIRARKALLEKLQGRSGATPSGTTGGGGTENLTSAGLPHSEGKQ